MMRALLAGLTGLRSHQVRMDVIGDNIANANTLGFKASRVSFKEAFAQKMMAGVASGSGVPRALEIGTGAGIGSIGTVFTQGALESTGRPFDLAIQGNGLFVVRNGDRIAYTRAGDFQLDAQGRLLLPGVEAVLQGATAAGDGTVGSAATVGDLVIPLDSVSASRATSEIRLGGNLDAAAAPGATRVVGGTAYDASGQAHDLQITFTNVSPGSWSWKASCDGTAVTATTDGAATFDAEGKLATFTYPDGAAGLTLPDVRRGFGQRLHRRRRHGGRPGHLLFRRSFHRRDAQPERPDGRNPRGGRHRCDRLDHRLLHQRGLAGLRKDRRRCVQQSRRADPFGDGLYAESDASGPATIGFAIGGPGTAIASGALEGSNVDISQEFSDMIITQRGFQASARIVATADEMLNEVVGLLR